MQNFKANGKITERMGLENFIMLMEIFIKVISKGQWLNDKAHGKGTYTHKNGTIYVG